MIDEGTQFVFEIFDPVHAVEGFVEPKEGNDRVCLDNGQPFVWFGIMAFAVVGLDFRSELLSTGKCPRVFLAGFGAVGGRVAREAHVPEGQLFVGELFVESCFKRIEQLHSRGQAVAEEGNRFALGWFQWQRGGGHISIDFDGLQVFRTDSFGLLSFIVRDGRDDFGADGLVSGLVIRVRPRQSSGEEESCTSEANASQF